MLLDVLVQYTYILSNHSVSEGSLCSAQAKHMRTRLCRAKRNLITPQSLGVKPGGRQTYLCLSAFRTAQWHPAKAAELSQGLACVLEHRAQST